MNIVSFCWLLIVVFQTIYSTTANWITGNLCWSMPCMNGGSCFGSASSYLCICPINYTGVLCEKRLGVCQENPCGNRGLCVETSLTSFECRCYFGYMGPTCNEHVLDNNPNIWSSLLPVHTRILFDMLQQAYHAKLKGRSSIGVDSSKIDFVGLLTTNEPTLAISMPLRSTATKESTFATHQSDTTATEHIIQAQDIQLERIFTDVKMVSTLDRNTNEFTEQFDNFTTSLSYPETETTLTIATTDNTTASVTEQLERSLLNTIADQEMISTTEHSNAFFTLTPVQLFSDANNIDSENLSAETVTSFDYDMFTTTPPIDFTSDSVKMLVNDCQTAHSQLLFQLCQRTSSHILPDMSSTTVTATTLSSPSDSSSVNNNNSDDTLLSWLRKHFNLSTGEMKTSTIPSLSIATSSIALQRVDMDDVLHQMNNIIDSEH